MIYVSRFWVSNNDLGREYVILYYFEMDTDQMTSHPPSIVISKPLFQHRKNPVQVDLFIFYALHVHYQPQGICNFICIDNAFSLFIDM